ncbi:hypothetical protein BG842_08185 [Haladaptatus sp. W1]|uniref:DUF7319 domain-containing protein n=1 Tax=Haladaptatus sp. W1 TaxID=1897478 RepID=UPI0008497576|nr:DUF308 domain-containing protein [Haladaptatus sp. W1]ODR79106.1 hypothetical protein BG842_08185 [Haladaptatus sp. W1]
MADSDSGTEGVDDDAPEKSREELRREVDDKYDFENFGPEDMAEMSLEEWEVAFDPDSWITGTELLDRVEADLKHRIAIREVFAVVERITRDGEPQLAAYSDEGYAIVYPDGSVEGRGTVLRDVKPTVALASMDEYEVPEMPEGGQLPQPDEVTEGSGELGNKLMQTIGAIHVLGGIGMIIAWLLIVLGVVGVADAVRDGAPLLALVGGAFFVFGLFVLLIVANARLSDRFRSEEYRNRLRSAGVESGMRPDFLPVDEKDQDD